MAERDMIVLKFEEAQRLFDLAIQMDTMCSGYMETDDVELMRALAIRLGVDPKEATPSQFAGKYPHDFRPIPAKSTGVQLAWLKEGNPPGSDPSPEWLKTWQDAYQSCAVWQCHKPKGDPIHGDQS
jgi:hypothetical protein